MSAYVGSTVYEAVRWSGSNLSEVEAWLRGLGAESVKLDPDDPAVVLYWDEDGRRHSCRSPSWMVVVAAGEIVKLSDAEFERLYAPAPLDEVGELRRTLSAKPGDRWVKFPAAWLSLDGNNKRVDDLMVEAYDPPGERLRLFSPIDVQASLAADNPERAELSRWRCWAQAVLKLDEDRALHELGDDTLRGRIGIRLLWYASTIRRTADGHHAQVISGRVVAELSPDELASDLNFALGDLAEWRRWALELLREPEGGAASGPLRRKIAAVLEAPSVIEVQGEAGVSDEVLVPGRFQVTLSAPSLDAFRGLVSRYARVVGDRPTVADMVREVSSPPSVDQVVVEACARVAHEVYREAIGDPEMPAWDSAPNDVRGTALAAVAALFSDESTTPRRWQEAWVAEKVAAGWTHGPIRDDDGRRHPNLLPYDQLPEGQHLADRAFVAAARATRRALDDVEASFPLKVATFKPSGDLTPEKVQEVLREGSWKTPILSADSYRYEQVSPSLGELRGITDDQLWYVGHPVHPTEEEVAAYRAREDEVIAYGRGVYEAKSPGFVVECRKSDREIREEVIRANVANAKRWLAWLVRRFPGTTFIAPWIAVLDGGGDDDLDPEARRRGLRDCCRTIRVCHGMVHVGGRVSGGMAEEAGHARAVVDLTSLGHAPPATIEVSL